jgi:glycerol-3-phosphate acyltransferase PlsY
MMLDSFIALVIGYLLGSIPFGLLLTRFAGLGDIRDIGSGNIGATNVLRTGNKALAGATLLLDIAKGFGAVFLIKMIFADSSFLVALAGIAGIGAFLGHLFPLWLKFKGGKGVAVYIGVLLALNLTAGLVFIVMWAFFAASIRISSVAALSAASAAPFIAYIFSGPHLAGAALFMSLLLFFKHKENIKRIIAGTEPKIGEK